VWGGGAFWSHQHDRDVNEKVDLNKVASLKLWRKEDDWRSTNCSWVTSCTVAGCRDTGGNIQHPATQTVLRVINQITGTWTQYEYIMNFFVEFLFYVTDRHLVPRLRISGATTPLPPHAFVTRTGTTLPSLPQPLRLVTMILKRRDAAPPPPPHQQWYRPTPLITYLHARRGIQPIFSSTLLIFAGDALKTAVTAVQCCSSLHSGILKYRRLRDDGQTYSNVEPIYHQHHDIRGWRE